VRILNNKESIRMALAGNPNVGKSVIFNQLTGLNQYVANWPGKTVEKVEGILYFKGYKIRILDLPGTYSLSAYSIEEIISRDYIAIERPDVIINVVDASALERNLYLTIQLLELEAPIVMALNQVDFAARRGIKVNAKKLSELLGIPVIPTVAISGTGIQELISKAVEVAKKGFEARTRIRFGREIEERIEKLELTVSQKLPELSRTYPPRWIATKLLEKDANITEKVKKYPMGEEVLKETEKLIKEIEEIHGEDSAIVFASERYSIANKIAKEVVEFVVPPKVTLGEKLDAITTHKIMGYPILALIMAGVFTTIFFIGDIFIGILEEVFEHVISITYSSLYALSPLFADIISNGILMGIAAGVTIVFPYIIPFYVLLAILEDSGYLPRASFLMDNLMHKLGLHGKAFIPFLLGYGCNVPACIGCRIMETERERFLCGFLVVLVPCSARTIVILGLVGKYVGIEAALALYLINLVLILLLGRITFKVLPGEPVGLIMEMPAYRRPSIKTIVLKTWTRTKSFTYMAFPIIVIGSTILEALKILGFLQPISEIASPLLVNWLGLPKELAIPLILGVLRKELTLIMLSELFGTLNFAEVLTRSQMIVFSLVTMLYFPCVATFAALVHEFGWKKALTTAFVDILLALFLGGLAFRVLEVFI